MYSALWLLAVLPVVYVGSYFFFVHPVSAGLGAGGTVHYTEVIPWYWPSPSWVHAEKLYGPIHHLDKKLLRPSRWTPPTKDGVY